MNINNTSMPECKGQNMSGESLAANGKPASGYVTLGYYIARLAEEIVLNENSCQCDMCAIGSCDSQVSGVTCLNGVTVWLMNQAETFVQDADKREAEYFSFLNTLSDTQIQDAVSLMETRFPHFKMTVGGVKVIIAEWQARKGWETI